MRTRDGVIAEAKSRRQRDRQLTKGRIRQSQTKGGKQEQKQGNGKRQRHRWKHSLSHWSSERRAKKSKGN